MVTHQLQVERRTGKVRRPETDVLPLCHATNLFAVGLPENHRPQNAGVGLAIGGFVFVDCGLGFGGDGLGYGLSVDTRSIVVITACGAVACICSWTATHSWPKYSSRSLTSTSVDLHTYSSGTFAYSCTSHVVLAAELQRPAGKHLAAQSLLVFVHCCCCFNFIRAE